jgi:hypothetical protein
VAAKHCVLGEVAQRFQHVRHFLGHFDVALLAGFAAAAKQNINRVPVEI